MDKLSERVRNGDFDDVHFGYVNTATTQIADEIAALEARLEAAEQTAYLQFLTLDELCRLKKIKDTAGKTPEYLEYQPKAWNSAVMLCNGYRAMKEGQP